MTSTTVSITEFNALKAEVNRLKEMVRELAEKLTSKEYKDLTPKELMYNASILNDVSSKWNPDDDNVADPKNIKPFKP